MYHILPPANNINASISLPGSKSYTNRALIAASIAGGNSVLTNPSASDDSVALRNALEKLGVKITEHGQEWHVSRSSADFAPFQGEIDVGPAGTSMRFLTALLASIPGCEVLLKGSERMHQRPIDSLVDALRSLGASIDYQGQKGCPPLLIKGQQLRCTERILIDGSKSSQFISALLLSAPRIPGLAIEITGSLVSQSYLEMALDTIREFGGQIESSSNRITHVCHPTPYQAKKYHVEADASGACYFWGLAAVNRGKIEITGVNPKSVQGDMYFPELLREMGCIIEYGENSVSVSATKQLSAINCDMTLLPDSAQTLAVIAATALGRTYIKGLSTLRIKETDRLLALKTELSHCAINSEIDQESIAIIGATPQYAEISTYEDHRMAMSFALLGALSCGVAIHEPQVVTKSFPDFWQRLKNLGFSVREIA
jgi:3-phosphoshikimate 1-carboxyvinyltransferase